MEGFRKRNYNRCANIVCLNRGVHPNTLLTSWLCQNPRLTELLQSDPKNTKAPGQMDNLLSPGFLDSQNAIYCEVVECLFDAAGPADFQIFDALIPP
jgi:hypothetical protein